MNLYLDLCFANIQKKKLFSNMFGEDWKICETRSGRIKSRQAYINVGWPYTRCH